MNNQVRNVTVK